MKRPELIIGKRQAGKTSELLTKVSNKAVKNNDKVAIVVPSEAQAKYIRTRLMSRGFPVEYFNGQLVYNGNSMERLKGRHIDFLGIDNFWSFPNPKKLLERASDMHPQEISCTMDNVFDVTFLNPHWNVEKAKDSLIKFYNPALRSDFDTFEFLQEEIRVSTCDNVSEKIKKEWYINLGNKDSVGPQYIDGLYQFLDIPRDVSWNIHLDDMNNMMVVFTKWRDEYNESSG